MLPPTTYPRRPTNGEEWLRQPAPGRRRRGGGKQGATAGRPCPHSSRSSEASRRWAGDRQTRLENVPWAMGSPPFHQLLLTRLSRECRSEEHTSELQSLRHL